MRFVLGGCVQWQLLHTHSRSFCLSVCLSSLKHTYTYALIQVCFVLVGCVQWQLALCRLWNTLIQVLFVLGGCVQWQLALCRLWNTLIQVLFVLGGCVQWQLLHTHSHTFSQSVRLALSSLKHTYMCTYSSVLCLGWMCAVTALTVTHSRTFCLLSPLKHTHTYALVQVLFVLGGCVQWQLLHTHSHSSSQSLSISLLWNTYTCALIQVCFVFGGCVQWQLLHTHSHTFCLCLLWNPHIHMYLFKCALSWVDVCSDRSCIHIHTHSVFSSLKPMSECVQWQFLHIHTHSHIVCSDSSYTFTHILTFCLCLSSLKHVHLFKCTLSWVNVCSDSSYTFTHILSFSLSLSSLKRTHTSWQVGNIHTCCCTYSIPDVLHWQNNNKQTKNLFIPWFCLNVIFTQGRSTDIWFVCFTITVICEPEIRTMVHLVDIYFVEPVSLISTFLLFIWFSCLCVFRVLVLILIINDNNNERISRAPFHMKHAQLRRTGANAKIQDTQNSRCSNNHAQISK